jgi:repressor LexA
VFTTRGKENRRRVLEFIESSMGRNGYPPSIREICSGVGIASTKAVKYHIDALVNSGQVRRKDRCARALEMPNAPFALPLLGRIAAGQPILAVENVEEQVNLSRFRGCFMLRVKGDSMIGAGIHDADIVIVQPQESVRNGDIAVAMLDNEATIKRFVRDGNSIRLEPENPKYRPISVTAGTGDFKLVGRVVGLLRDYT